RRFDTANVFGFAAVEVAQAHLAGVLHTRGEGCSLVGSEWHCCDSSSQLLYHRGHGGTQRKSFSKTSRPLWLRFLRERNGGAELYSGFDDTLGDVPFGGFGDVDHVVLGDDGDGVAFGVEAD